MKFKRALSFGLIMALVSANTVFADMKLTTKKNYSQAQRNLVEKENGEMGLPTLTVEEATKKAIDYSPTLKTLSENKVESNNSYEDLNFSFAHSFADSSISSTSSNQQMAYNIRALNNALRSLSANEEIAKEAIALNIESLFNSIKVAQDDIDLHEQNMVIQEKNIEIAKVKKSLGLMSEVEYNNIVNNYNTTVAEKQSLENSIESAFRSLNDAMGTNLDTKYEIVLDEVEYEPMGAVDLQSCITRALNTSENIRAKKDAADLAEYDYKTYVPVSDQTGLNDTKKNASKSAAREYETAQTELQSKMTDLYESIKDTEQTYIDTLGTLSVLKNQYDVIKAQYELGKVTEVDLLTAEYNISQVEAGIDKIVRGHKILVQQFNNPNLIQ
ncbi:MAG: TolC family protein [Lachnospirales bacterium]